MQTPDAKNPKTTEIKEAGLDVRDELRTSAHEVADEASAAGRSVAQSIKSQGAETISALKSEMKTAAHQQQAQLAAGLSGIGSALNNAAHTLEAERNPAFASATRSVARYIDDASHRVASSSPKQLLHTVRDTARTHPALFIGGAALVGFAVGRFLRSSTRQTPPEPVEQRLQMPQHLSTPQYPPHVHDARVGRGLASSAHRDEGLWPAPDMHDSLAQDLVVRRAR